MLIHGSTYWIPCDQFLSNFYLKHLPILQRIQTLIHISQSIIYLQLNIFWLYIFLLTRPSSTRHVQLNPHHPLQPQIIQSLDLINIYNPTLTISRNHREARHISLDLFNNCKLSISNSLSFQMRYNTTSHHICSFICSFTCLAATMSFIFPRNSSVYNS